MGKRDRNTVPLFMGFFGAWLKVLKILDIQKTNTRIFHMLDIYKRGSLMVFELVDDYEKS